MSILQILVIFAAAFIAGMINSVAGGGTLITFPALVWIGYDPRLANMTSTVALWPGSLGGMLGFRRELGEGRRWMLLFGPPSLLGGIVGALLLLHTAPRTFASLAPYLVLFATALFAVGDQITRRLRRPTEEELAPQAVRKPDRAWLFAAASFQFFVAVYGGYFGAGIGILMLAALGLLGLTDLHQMNGLKNFFAVCINLIAAVMFIWSGQIRWPEVLVMAAGAIAGGYGGAGLARRLGRVFVRRTVIVIGLLMTLSMFLFRS